MLKNLFIFIIVIILFLLILAGCFQEKLMFFPEKLSPGFRYNFRIPFEEVNYHPEEDVTINALHFKADSSKGVILYMHGNAGSLQSWGSLGETFVSAGYDLLIFDYRGFGKSTGKISEKALYSDAQFIYDKLKDQYGEDKITVYGRSIGTGIAAYIAAHNSPRRLILETPYYNMSDLAGNLYPAIPRFLLRYKFATNEYLPRTKARVYIFHGTDDEVIYYGSSEKLKKHFKEGDTLIAIPGGHHNDLESYPEFSSGLKKALE